MTDAAPKRGETALVSGAAGGVGSLAGQIFRLLGARVIGLAGTDEKCRTLTDQLGFDAAINYRSSRLREELLGLMPHGPDVYFDNVGGSFSQTIMWTMRHGSRVVECGQIATYDDEGGGWILDIRPIQANGLRFEGFTPLHFQDFIPGATAQLSHWLQTGRIVAIETVVRGIEAAPKALPNLFRGDNIGKMVVTIADEV